MYRELQFIKFLNKKNISDKRKSQIIYEVKQLFKFMKYYRKPKIDDILDYKQHVLKQNAHTTFCFKFSCINQYLNFIGIDKVNYKYVSPGSNDLLTILDYRKILKSCEALKEISIVKTFFYTGIRISELQQITMEGLNKKFFTIYRKNVSREIPIHKSLHMQLMKYCTQNNITSGSIFISNRGNQISVNAITYLLSKIARKAKIKICKLTKTHNFRRLFIINTSKNGMAIDKIQKIVGHNSIDTTSIYFNYSPNDYYNDVNRFVHV